MTKMPVEIRNLRASAEVRENAAGQPMIVGYGAVFNRDSSDLGFLEQVDPAAFTKTLGEADVRGLANHDPNWILGRTKAGTMRIRTDSNGLYYEIDVNTADPDGQRALAKVKRGDWDGSSFSFTTVRDEWNWDASPPQRRLLEVALIDVGPVTFPAYPDSTATSRALEPIAEKVGRPVDELVTALRSGEIRSLINPGGTMTTTDTEPAMADVEERAEEQTDTKETLPEAVGVEERAGKMISAANMERLMSIHQNLMDVATGLRDLMDAAKWEEPAESGFDPDEGMPESDSLRSISALQRDVEFRLRLVEADAA